MRANWRSILKILLLLSIVASAATLGRSVSLSTTWFVTGLIMLMTLLASLWKVWLALAVWVPSALYGMFSLLVLYHPSSPRARMGDLEQVYVIQSYVLAAIHIGAPLAIYCWRLKTQKTSAKAGGQS